VPDLVVNGVAYDTPILGYGVNNVNLLRLWKSEAPESFDFQAFNVGDYYGAVHAKMEAETISKVLYPNDEPEAGKELRLKQQYFFVSCSLQDMIRLQLGIAGSLDGFHEKFAVQLNDTHPALAVAELMRLLMDEHGMPGTRPGRSPATCHFTNHTLLPEALETWPVRLFERLLPRHLEIIYEINRRFLDEVGCASSATRQHRAHVADRRGRRAPGAHGAPGRRRQQCHQRRRRAAHRAAQVHGHARLLRVVAGEVPQRHQRRHAAPLHGRQQSTAGGTDHRDLRRRPLGARPGPA
jgi:glycogen/starch/alpha-glucan phosphorylase-like protein